MRNFETKIEWIEPGKVKSAELKSTWSALKISVGGTPITKVFDSELTSVREHLFVPTYPLAEWIAFNWWNLLYECLAAGRSEDYSYRHCLRFGREGFSFPDLQFNPMGEVILLRWNSLEGENSKLEYLKKGAALIEMGEMEDVFRRIIGATIERLHDNKIFSSPLEEEWNSISSADEHEKEFCIAAAALGLNPYEVSETLSEAIIKVGEALPKEIFYQFLSAANVQNLENQAEELKVTIQNLHEKDAEYPLITEIKNKASAKIRSLVSMKAQSPWKEGYLYAQALREYLSLDDNFFSSTSDLASKFGVNLISSSSITGNHGTQKLYDSLLVINKSRNPEFLVPKKLDATKKFAFSRSLFEYLFTNVETASLATSTYSSQQKRNRAFAAEFLAPSSFLKKEVRTKNISSDDVEELAKHMGVSDMIIINQLSNHGIIESIDGSEVQGVDHEIQQLA